MPYSRSTKLLWRMVLKSVYDCTCNVHNSPVHRLHYHQFVSIYLFKYSLLTVIAFICLRYTNFPAACNFNQAFTSNLKTNFVSPI